MSGIFGQVAPVTVPDLSQTLVRGQQFQANRLAMLAQQRQLAQQDQLSQFFRDNAAGFAATDPNKRMNLLAMLAQQGGQGAAMALPQMQALREEMEWTGAGQTPQAGAQPAAMPAAGAAGPANPQWEDRSLPRGIRNNNPLNLSYVSGQPGVQGSDGRFGRYQTMEEGIAAATRQLQIYARRGLNTVEQIVGRWAPPNENNTSAYVATVARELGVDPRAPINVNDPMMLSRLVNVMARVENGRPLDPEVVARGVQRGLGGGGDTAPASSGDAIPAQAAAQGGGDLPAVPGFDMARVRRAINLPNNAAAQRYLQSYMQAAQLMRRGETEPLETVAGPDGNPVLVPRSQAAGRTPIRLPSTVVNNNMPGDNVRNRADAATLQAVQEGAGQARAVLSLLDRAEQAVRRVPEGAGAQLVPILGQIGAALGFNVSGASEAEVLRSITTQLGVLQRVPGSGATTDFEMRLYMQAVPRLGSTREGNLRLIEMGRRLAERKVEEANIWRRHAGDADIFDRLNALPPLFSEDERRFLGEDATPTRGPGTPPPQAGTGLQGEPPPPPAPARPSIVPEGSAYSPSRRQWRTPDGRIFNQDGTPAR